MKPILWPKVGGKTEESIRLEEIEDILFQDPLSELTRRVRRNLVVASTIGIIVAAYIIQVVGFSGVSVAEREFPSSLINGGVSIAIIYFLVSYFLYFIIDYVGWDVQREIRKAKPYLSLVKDAVNFFRLTSEKIEHATQRMTTEYLEEIVESEIKFREQIKSTKDNIETVEEYVERASSELTPRIQEWERSISKFNRLETRKNIRLASLWLVDLFLPVVLALFALGKNMEMISPFVSQVFR